MRSTTWRGSLFAGVMVLASCGNSEFPDASDGARSDAARDGIDSAAVDVAPDLPCSDGQSTCRGSCVDLRTDNANCGSCGMLCASGVACAAGTCSCNRPSVVCNGRCVDPQTDATNCGACGTACPMGQSCVMGSCSIACDPPRLRCGMPGSTVCVDPQSDTMNCGVCGAVCSDGYSCTAGRCVCSAPRTMCGATCGDLQTDVDNCGMCGVTCGPGGVCTAGRCTCVAGRTSCGGSCVDIMTDESNCGRCGVLCMPTFSCAAARCVCAIGQTLCSGECADLMTNADHCGTCTRSCGTGGLCTAGVCGCATGYSRCGALCADIRYDRTNCGRCGTVCPGTQLCVMGACTATPPTHYIQIDAPESVAFVNACTTTGHTNILPSTDDGSAIAMLPFPFRYWTVDLPMGAPVNIASNGWMGMNGVRNASLGGAIPAAAAPNSVIAALWTDLITSLTGICLATVGTAPNRRWVVQWLNAHNYPSGGSMTFEIVLSETSGTIDLVYRTMTRPGAGSVGIENETGMMGMNGCMGIGMGMMCSPPAGTAIRFTPTP